MNERVLYVADRVDAPYRYRCLHAVRQLRDSGVVANLRALDDLQLLDEVPRYSLVVLFRLGWSPRVETLVARAREHGAALAFDIDDLIFDPSAGERMPFVHRLPQAEQDRYRSEFAELQRTLLACDFCIGSTPAIARAAEAQGKPAIVHPNLLAAEHLAVSAAIARLRPLLCQAPWFGYLSGSNTHDGDLASIAAPLAEALDALPALRFVICGFAELPEGLARHRARIVRLPFQDFRAYPWLLGRLRAVLAPLEAINEFTDAKSALKIFEAGACAVPAIATPAASYAASIQPGISGLLARDSDEWRAALLRLADRSESLRMGKAARTLALRDHSPAAYANKLARALGERAGRCEGSPPLLEPLAAIDGARDVLRVARRSAALALLR